MTQSEAYDQGFNHGWYAWTHYVDLDQKFHGNQELIGAYKRGFDAGYQGTTREAN